MQNEVPGVTDNRTNFSFEITRAQQLLLHQGRKGALTSKSVTKLQVPETGVTAFPSFTNRHHCPHSLPQWAPVGALGYLPTHLKIMQIQSSPRGKSTLLHTSSHPTGSTQPFQVLSSSLPEQRQDYPRLPVRSGQRSHSWTAARAHHFHFTPMYFKTTF